MLLCRITQHVKEQNWFAVMLDFVIVVVGILIALQVTNWSEFRSERVQEREIIERLHVEFVQIISELDEKIIHLEAVIPRHKQLANVLKNPHEQPDKVEISRLVKNIFSLPSPPSVADTYSEIVANGTISFIKNNSLRSILIKHATDSRAYMTSQQSTRAFTRPYVMPLSRFVFLLDDMTVNDALENASSKADMLIALNAYSLIFNSQLLNFIEIRESLNNVIQSLKSEMDANT